MSVGQPPVSPEANAVEGGSVSRSVAQPAATLNKRAIAAIALGVGAPLTCGFSGVPALLLGLKARREIMADPGRFRHRWTGIGGTIAGVFGCCYLGLAVLGIAIAIVVPKPPEPVASVTASAAPTSAPPPAKASKPPPRAPAKKTAVVPPAASSVASATTAPPSEQGLLTRPGVVVLKKDPGALEREFWALFDELAKAREEAATGALKESKPATWQTLLVEEKKRVAAERKGQRDRIGRTVYGLSISLRMTPEYDNKSKSFVSSIPAIHDMGKAWLDNGDQRWWVTFGTPTVKTEDAHPLLAKMSGQRQLKYSFQGGRALKWTIAIAPEEADAYHRSLAEDQLSAEVLFKTARVLHDRGRPEWAANALSDNPSIAKTQRAARTGAGRALIANVIAWRVFGEKGNTYASWEAKKP